MTIEQIKELRELESVALPLPWRQGESTHQAVADCAPGAPYRIADFHHGHEQVFVCALRNAAPALLDAVEENASLRSVVDAARTIIQVAASPERWALDLTPLAAALVALDAKAK